ncbi:thymidylate kinase [Ameyamaea chiangmaiensis NBRC 103196]|uniref:Thymidylate kinase n=1 Tax=Ameyamaea chiangmaiensis TaxID=442969 RepID=A0A850PIS9_9PROT|nr:dTMP kinase [Ameyamaea chiangmaiensis]MBS4073598.1 dTMP kinase [Ameyamaea chiangmaiensis]NVN41712.1 dTMP kinase [Ameyamaea chiangmaiensis]GBQ69126.1 thymidylate kinase [Ameyamaea chiangmaiensis NBRC 103196]
MTGFFLTFEGGEGAGKSTQTRLLAERLRQQGHRVVVTREPGGAPGAEALREFLLFSGHELSLRAEIFAMFAARADHVDTLIRPALERGDIVLCDRFTDSTEAYQAWGRGEANPDMLRLVNALQDQIGRSPDLTLMLEVPREVALERLAARGGRTDRFEASTEAFHERVRRGFGDIGRRNPHRCVSIDATGAPDVVAEAVFATVAGALASRRV